MTGVRQTVANIIIAGVDATAALRPYLISISHCDDIDREADTLDNSLGQSRHSFFAFLELR